MKKVEVNTWREWKRWKWTLAKSRKCESEHLKRMKKMKVNTWREWKKWKWTLEENEKGESEHLKRMKKVKTDLPQSPRGSTGGIRDWRKESQKVTWERFLRFFIYKKIELCLAIKSTEKDFWDFSFTRKLNIVLQSSPLRKIFEIFHFQENWILTCNQVHLPVPAGLREDRQGCRAQGGCSSCCRWSGRRDLVMMMLMMTMMVMVMAMMMFMMMTMMITIRLSWRP